MSHSVAILLPDLRGGGVESTRLRLATAFSRQGLSVEFVLMRKNGSLLESICDQFIINELEADRLRRAIWPIAAYLRRRRPGALLVSMWPLTSIAVWARDLARVPTRIIVCDHTDYTAAPAGGTAIGRLKLRATMRLSYPRADAVVAVSHGVAEATARFAGLAKERITVIHNPVFPPTGRERAAPCSASLAWAEHRGPRLIAIGSLKPAKDYPLLVRAFARLRHQVDARLLILGEGALRVELEALSGQLGVASHVDMPGFVPRPWPYLARANLFVLSSAWEGFGNVIVEALACGTPVVSTDCRSGPREILEGGRHGRLVPVGDADALAAAMLASLNEKHDRAVLIRRAGDFSIEKATDAYLKLLLPDINGPLVTLRPAMN